MDNMTPTILPGFMPPHLLSAMPPDTPILVALSGGADSAALLMLLVRHAKTTGAPLSVAHVDHKLRGEESDADREFCRRLSQSLGLPFYSLEADVAALAKQNRLGIEEQARAVRYEFFESLMDQHHIPLLATAHNADDNAETVLFHLTRGSGLGGMRGIPPTRPFGNGLIIRPLLHVAKKDILDFCRAEGVTYVTDRTNEDISYARNRLRHRVLPELTQINSGAIANISRLCATLRADEDYLDHAVDAFLEQHATQNAVCLAALKNAHTAIASRAIRRLTLPLTDSATVHVEAILRLAEAAVPHSSLDLGNGVRAIIEDGTLCFTNQSQPSPVCYQRELRSGGNPIPEADALVWVQFPQDKAVDEQEIEKLKNIYKKATTIRIRFDRIYGSLVAQPRQSGDVILCGGMHKKVKKMMCDRKLAPQLRHRLPILRDSHGIVWIPTLALRDSAAEDGQAPCITLTLFHNF